MEDKNNVVDNGVQDTNTEPKTFTQEEVNEMLKGYKSQEEINDIVNKRLARERKDIKAQIEAEVKQAEELAKLSEQEKATKLLELKEKELNEKIKAFEHERLLNETSKQLASKNLPIEFAEILVGKDAESTFANISLFEVKFNEAREKSVVERLKGNAPRVATTKVSAITKEDFKKMNMMQRQKLYAEDRELYNELTK